MADFLNIHLAQVLVGIGAMVWIYVNSSNSNGGGSGGGSSGDSATTVAAAVVETYKHL